jgi:DNA-binding MarR family transcriptional regulator
MKNQTVNLTVNEAKTLESLINSMYAEYNFSDVDINDISKFTNIPTKKLRGIISSLVKKDLVEKEENDSGFVILYLTDLVAGYVNNWRNEAGEPVKLSCNGQILFA